MKSNNAGRQSVEDPSPQ